jgi:hypothetical protein
MNALSPSIGFQNPTFPLQHPTGAQAQGVSAEVQMAFLLALAQLSSLLNSAGNGGGAGGLVTGSPQFGGASNGNSLPSFLGNSSSTGGSPLGGSSGGPSGGGSGQSAVDYARQFQGRDSSSIKGKMKHFTAAGGITNNCCDFVSSALEGQGLVKGHHINVKSFEQELKKQGYKQVPASQARPGDVWISPSRGHTELVASKGATKLIGSNNNGDSRQEITEHASRPGSGIIYQKG